MDSFRPTASSAQAREGRIYLSPPPFFPFDCALTRDEKPMRKKGEWNFPSPPIFCCGDPLSALNGCVGSGFGFSGEKRKEAGPDIGLCLLLQTSQGFPPIFPLLLFFLRGKLIRIEKAVYGPPPPSFSFLPAQKEGERRLEIGSAAHLFSLFRHIWGIDLSALHSLPGFLGCGAREGEFVFRSSLEGRNGEYNNGEKEKTEETERKKRERERLVQFPSFLSPFFLFELLMKRGEEEEGEGGGQKEVLFGKEKHGLCCLGVFLGGGWQWGGGVRVL